MHIDEPELARRLRHEGIDVSDVAVGPGGVAVVYTTTLPGAEPAHGEMGRVCTAFLDLVEAGDLEPTRVEATALRHETDVQATWHIEAGWFDDLAAYRVSEEEFSARVLDTVDADPPVDAEGGVAAEPPGLAGDGGERDDRADGRGAGG